MKVNVLNLSQLKDGKSNMLLRLLMIIKQITNQIKKKKKKKKKKTSNQWQWQTYKPDDS